MEQGKKFREYLTNILSENHLKAVVVNLEQIFNIDSWGFGVILTISQNLRKEKIPFALAQPSDFVAQLCTTNHLQKIIPIYDTEEEATKSFQGE